MSRNALYLDLLLPFPGYDFHEIELSKDDGLPEWRSRMKLILKKTSLNLNQHVMFLYDGQLICDERFLEDINNILLLGEIPNLYTVDERQEIVENMRTLEKQLEKHMHTDGSGPALFALFVRRVKENMHVILAMNPLSGSFNTTIARLAIFHGIIITIP